MPITPAMLTQVVAPAPYVDRFARVLGSSLGPEQATAILAMADQGYLWTLADLLEECRQRDGHLHGDLTRRELRVVGAEWELRPPEGSGAEGAAVAKWCTQRLREMEGEGDLSRDFTGMVADMMGAIYHGRAAHEMVWRPEPSPTGGEWLIPQSAEWIHPRRFAYQTDWRLHVWDSSGTAVDATRPANTDSPFGQWPGVPLREANKIAPGKFVVCTPRVMGAYPTREGVGRLTLWYAIFKRMEIREWAALLAWAGRGLRIGTYKTDGNPGDTDPAATVDHKTELERALLTMGGTMPAVVPNTCEIDVRPAPGEGQMQSAFHEMCDAEMSKAIHTSTLGSSVSKAGGSRAQGQVHERGELANARGDAMQIGTPIDRMLLRPMTELNFGRRDLAPRIVFATDPAADLDALSERMVKWVSIGGRVGQRTGANALQMPEIEDDEETVTPPAKDAPAAAPGTPRANAAAPASAPNAGEGTGAAETNETPASAPEGAAGGAVEKEGTP